jgi:glycerol uptake facilitator-like aquaporin
MEIPGGQIKIASVCLYEFLGTATLSVAYNWASTSIRNFPSIISVTIMAIYVIFGPVSGAHVNPAVTIGVLLREPWEKVRSNLKLFSLIILSQICGALCGSLISLLGYIHHLERDKNFAQFVSDTNFFLLCPAKLPGSASIESVDLACINDKNWFEIALAEATASFLFVLVVLSVKYSNGTGDEAIDGASIGASFLFALKTIETFTVSVYGGKQHIVSLNPAVAIG